MAERLPIYDPGPYGRCMNKCIRDHHCNPIRLRMCFIKCWVIGLLDGINTQGGI